MGVLARKLLSPDAAESIQFVGGKSDTKDGATSGNSTITLDSGLSGGIASSVSDGDFVIAAFATTSTANRTLSITDGTNPYTLIGSELYSDDGADSNLRVAYKFVSGDTSITFGPTGNASDPGVMAVYVFRNVNQTTPLDVAVTTATGTNTGLANPPSISPVTDGTYIVVVGSGAVADPAARIASSDLTNFLSLQWSDTYHAVLGIGQKDDWSSGSFDPAAFTYSAGGDFTVNSWCAMTIAIRPV